MANINAFRASLVNGLARPNQFQVNLSFPTFVTNGAAASALGQFHCKATTLPESIVQPIPVFYQGRSIPLAGERDFHPWSVQIYNEDFLIRNAMESWMNGFNNLSNNTGVIQPALYQTDMVIKHLDRNGTVVKEVRLVDAFPIQLGPIQLDFEAQNQVEMFDCTFAYAYYVSSDVNS